MAGRKHTPERKSRSGSHVPNSLRGTVRVEVRCEPELAERARQVARERGVTLARMIESGMARVEAGMVTVQGVEMTIAAARNVEETGADVRADVEALRSGAQTRTGLLEHCLDGADEDRVDGWREYVDAVAQAAGRDI